MEQIDAVTVLTRGPRAQSHVKPVEVAHTTQVNITENGTPTNLKPAWKPGKSGNPNGRPCVSAELKRMRDGDWPRNELMRLATDKRIKPETETAPVS